MHKELLKHVTDDKLREFTRDALSMIKETNHDLYEDLEMHLYKNIYGCHFSEWMVDKATKHMMNNDGSTGPHWTIEQTNAVAKQYGILFDKYNEYDWNYVMNMIFSDFYGIISNDVQSYVRFAKAWLEDKDGPEGKAFKYYYEIVK